MGLAGFVGQTVLPAQSRTPWEVRSKQVAIVFSFLAPFFVNSTALRLEPAVGHFGVGWFRATCAQISESPMVRGLGSETEMFPVAESSSKSLSRADLSILSRAT